MRDEERASSAGIQYQCCREVCVFQLDSGLADPSTSWVILVLESTTECALSE